MQIKLEGDYCRLERPVDPMIDWCSSVISTGASVLRDLRMSGVKYLSGAVIPKYPMEGFRAWHCDWWAWDTPETQWLQPPAVGVVFYLDKTSTINGVLTALPGSHKTAPWDYAKTMGSFRHHRDEAIIPVDAGDAVVLDSRLMHAVGAKLGGPVRVCVTMWYMTGWERLSERVKATVRLSMDTKWKPALGDFIPGLYWNRRAVTAHQISEIHRELMSKNH